MIVLLVDHQPNLNFCTTSHDTNDINKIGKILGESFRKCLIGIHNFTGYDNVDKFFIITKEKWLTPLVCTIYYSPEPYVDDLPSLVIECLKRKITV